MPKSSSEEFLRSGFGKGGGGGGGGGFLPLPLVVGGAAADRPLEALSDSLESETWRVGPEPSEGTTSPGASSCDRGSISTGGLGVEGSSPLPSARSSAPTVSRTAAPGLGSEPLAGSISRSTGGGSGLGALGPGSAEREPVV